MYEPLLIRQKSMRILHKTLDGTNVIIWRTSQRNVASYQRIEKSFEVALVLVLPKSAQVVSREDIIMDEREALTKSRGYFKSKSANNFLASELGFNCITLSEGHPRWSCVSISSSHGAPWKRNCRC